MRKMKAVVYTGFGRAEVREVGIPDPSPREHLIRIRFSGICGTDMAIWAGKHPRAKAPLILGHEMSGAIAAMAKENPRGLKEGNMGVVFPLLFCGKCYACRTGNVHVCKNLRFVGIDRDGGMAEYAIIPDSLFEVIPETMSAEDAVLIEPLAVVVHSTERSNVEKDNCVVVTGAGPIGLLQALVLRARGISNMTLLEINPYRIGIARKLGFDVIDSNDMKNVEDVINEKSDGEGADVLFEASGSKKVAEIMTELVRPLGKIVIVSVFKNPPVVDLRSVNFKELTFIGTRVYRREDYRTARDMILNRNVPVQEVVTQIVHIDEAPDIFQMLADGGDALKILCKSF